MSEFDNPFLPPGSSTQTGRTGNKVNFWLLIPLFLLAMVIVGGLIYYRKVSVPKTTEQKDVPAVETEGGLSHLDIAGITLGWLDKQRDLDGVYHYSIYCQQMGECDAIEGNPAGLAAIWGRFKHYRASGDKNDLAIIKKDLGIYIDRKKVETIQNDEFWNCRLMYEIWQNGSNLFSAEEKEKISEICFGSAYLDIEEAIGNQIEIDFVRYPLYSSDFLAKYLWKKDESDLAKANLYLEKANNLHNDGLSSGKSFSKLDECTLGIAFLDFFQTTKEKKHLDSAVNLWGKENPKQANGLFEKAVCAFFNAQFYKITSESKYLTSKENLLKDIIARHFNHLGYVADFGGDGSFLTLEANGKARNSIVENGLIVGLLSE